ncbi:MAG: ribonuclease H-like domain-containing protein [Planctomycetota bacterium]|nr:ribonuclease H-like domain-containing protein [Planctomycetota bacterium]
MLTRTFLHLPGSGPQRERGLWDAGVLCWDDCLARIPRDLFDESPAEAFEAMLCESRERLRAGDAHWFEERLGAEAWRLAPDFDDGRIVYLDIETDGSPGDTIPEDEEAPGGTTVVGAWDGREARVFLRGPGLDELPEYLNRYRVLCTFNGRSFDMPYLEKRFGKGFFAGAHLDLRPITRVVGLTGGLKKIEAQIGVKRPPPIDRFTGYDAVKLWRLFKQRQRTDALDGLARYNLADAVNLQAVLRAAYNAYIAQQKLPLRALRGTSDRAYAGRRGPGGEGVAGAAGVASGAYQRPCTGALNSSCISLKRALSGPKRSLA